nr:hypothetical protein CFP56_13363 [Quercus suber]
MGFGRREPLLRRKGPRLVRGSGGGGVSRPSKRGPVGRAWGSEGGTADTWLFDADASLYFQRSTYNRSSSGKVVVELGQHKVVFKKGRRGSGGGGDDDEVQGQAGQSMGAPVAAAAAAAVVLEGCTVAVLQARRMHLARYPTPRRRIGPPAVIVARAALNGA